MTKQAYLRVDGKSKLEGEISISGSKNSVLALIPALCLGDGVGVLYNSPYISDVNSMEGILEELGLNLSIEGNSVILDGVLKYSKLSPKYVSKLRASNLFLGVLLSKFGRAQVPFSGGDKIGDRPLDIHFHVFNKFGIEVNIEDGNITCNATKFPYDGQNIFLRYPSVGATENAILIAVLANSPSTITNAAMEPEIVDLSILLNRMGASISGAGTSVLNIKPVKQLHRVEHEVIPDRLEAGTFLFILAAARGKGVLRNVVPEHLMSVTSLLSDCGVRINSRGSDIYVDASEVNHMPNINVSALPYPGFPTDLQPFATVFATECTGYSTIVDNVHRERFAYLEELRKMGLIFEHRYDQVIISGPQKLSNAELEGRDIRMTAALIMSSLLARGESKVYGIQHLQRGYDDFFDKLRSLNASVVFVDEELT